MALSGSAALVYQVLWLRLLALTFGVTTFAASTVLASFFGGLALGSLVAGRYADRSRRPLRLFGFVELSIGVCALMTPVALSALHRAYLVVFPGLPDSLAITTLARFAMAFVVLLVPTALMGATLPVVIRSSLGRPEALGSRVGLLYFANTAGAIAGALGAGYYLIPEVGLSRSFLIAAGVNTLVGLAAIACSAILRPSSETPPGEVVALPTTPAAESWVTSVVLGVFVISGVASLALEVVWFRVLVVFLGPTTYAFTAMLACVLVGIAAGSALITPLLRLRLDWLQALVVLQFGAALMALDSLSRLWRAPRIPAWLESLSLGPTFQTMLPALVLSAQAILPTALFFGLAFPVGVRLWAGAAPDSRHTAERIGLFYSLNVCGGILGSTAAGFWLLPQLGSRLSLVVCAALFLVSGLALQVALMKRRPVVTVFAAAVAVIFVVRAQDVPEPLEMARRRVHSGWATLFHDEGVQTTVTVVGAGPGSRVLYLDGRHQANDSEAMVFVHRRIGLLPAVLHVRPRTALIVGLGGGATAGALSRFPGLQLDVVELSRGVMQASAFFSHVNFDVLGRPNVTARVDDGRNFLLRTRQRYDVITADAIVPQHAGASNVNSVEYFRLVRDALAPDGIVLHWNGGGTMTEYRLILRAFVEAFPLATLWGDGTLMVGTTKPLTVSRGRIAALLAEPATRDALALMHVETVDHLVRMFRAAPTDVRAFAGDGPMLTDDRPAIEYFASLPQDPRGFTGLARDPSGVIQP